MVSIMLSIIQTLQPLLFFMKILILDGPCNSIDIISPSNEASGSSGHHYSAATHSASESIDSSCRQHTRVLISDISNFILFDRIFNLFPLLALLFGIAFHLQLVLLSYHPIFLRPYYFLKLVSFLGAN